MTKRVKVKTSRFDGNRFRNPILKREYASAYQRFETKHQSLFFSNGLRRRSPDFGSSFARSFWMGYDGIVDGAGWDAESRKTLSYAHWCAGRYAAKQGK